uniref:Uncharacterized protein n=1 Tax=Arundo donax TaxID=35708 RepID=A0A0A9BSY4_ARUDO
MGGRCRGRPNERGRHRLVSSVDEAGGVNLP